MKMARAWTLFPLPWMIPDRSSPSRIRFATFRALDRSGPIRRRAVYEGKGGLWFLAVSRSHKGSGSALMIIADL